MNSWGYDSRGISKVLVFLESLTLKQMEKNSGCSQLIKLDIRAVVK